ncbi:unnamed protein product [Adineta steineri]|uniref:Uncharacterized protein n=1 Tax=Adineta steineri TaxID=433720 RepID=A0A814J3A5_9BILA|nr:unnamed protein product [Adineta steineri]CAF3618542.1 unnamed protein product [Adineta steineri]
MSLGSMRTTFLQNLTSIATASSEITVSQVASFLISTFEYARKRNLANSTVFEEAECHQLEQELPKVYQILGRGKGIVRLCRNTCEEDLFEYLKYLSAAKFLVDDFGKFVPNSPEKEQDVTALKEDFNEKWYFLGLNYNMDFEDPYPDGPKPDWSGVPESHYWWADIDNLYSLVWAKTAT